MHTTDIKDYKKLFVTTANEHLHSIDALLSINSSDSSTTAQEIFRHVHSLKGSSGVMGFKEITKICDEIDQLIRKGQNEFSITSGNAAQIKELSSKLKTLLSSIENETI